jgi:3',5'-cyclic AMP phosphodiesterase CpdA
LSSSGGRLLAVSDLHVGYPDNREVVDSLRPESAEDWLLLAGDVAELSTDIRWALTVLSQRFAKVVWAPGNHELWTHPQDPLRLRGQARYDYLVEMCREIGVLTPEDPYPVWNGAGGPVRIAALFVLYDYTFLMPGKTQEQALAHAHETGVVCSDEYLLHPDPFPSRAAWCRARVELTEQRLAECDPDIPLVLMNHFPLVRQPTEVLTFPQFAQWCGTELSAKWHLSFRTAAVVYGHLHIPRTTYYGDVRFMEVSLGYPKEWKRRGQPKPLLRPVLIDTAAA